jgi:hypothetical protein
MEKLISKLVVTASIWVCGGLSFIALHIMAPSTSEAQTRRAPTPPPGQTSLEEILDRLDELPPAWSEILPAESRFKLDGLAVRGQA